MRVSTVLHAIERINDAIRAGVPEKTVEELMNPDAQLPQVYPGAADLYQRELLSLQQQSPEVPRRLPPRYTAQLFRYRNHYRKGLRYDTHLVHRQRTSQTWAYKNRDA